eukprot:6482731-Amphidinium_carterae.1
MVFPEVPFQLGQHFREATGVFFPSFNNQESGLTDSPGNRESGRTGPSGMAPSGSTDGFVVERSGVPTAHNIFPIFRLHQRAPD